MIKPTSQTQTSEDRFIRFKDSESVTGVGRTTTYSYIRQGILPPPIKLGPRACGWWLSTLRSAINARKALGTQEVTP